MLTARPLIQAICANTECACAPEASAKWMDPQRILCTVWNDENGLLFRMSPD